MIVIYLEILNKIMIKFKVEITIFSFTYLSYSLFYYFPYFGTIKITLWTLYNILSNIIVIINTIYYVPF